MSDPPVANGPVYRAFISYSHQDRRWADWLHKALETWRVPRRLVGLTTAAGVIPRRLLPIFRDRDELASATDLGRKVNEALAQSASLIVVCSPHAAASRWVNEEVLAFKRLGRGERIFCLIVDGEPNASDLPGRAADECFCPALRHRLGADGRLGPEPAEPIAADVRPGKDGKANAKLKLIAGLLDVGFDRLRQREQQRHLRRLMAVTALAVAVMLVTTTLAISAVMARRDAERRQKQAEDLVGFMLGDLGDKLDEVHRLDIMQAVDDKAMAYFASLPAADATDAALTLRVNALEKIGNVRMDQGALPAAVEAYQAAVALAGELARRAPADAGRKAVWGDSLKWLGQAYWYQGDLGAALRNFESAGALLQAAHAASPADPDLAFQLAAAHIDSGRVLEARGDFTAAQGAYEAALALYQELAARDPKWQTYLGSAWDSLGKLALQRGQLEQAVTAYRTNQRIQSALAARTPGDHAQQEHLLLANAILGRTLGLCGELEAAVRYTDAAVQVAQALNAFDPAVMPWKDLLALYSQQLGGLQRQAGQLDAAARLDAEAVRILAELMAKDPTSTGYAQDFAQAQLEAARLHVARHAVEAAAAPADAALATVRTLRAQSPDSRSLLLLEAQLHLVRGTIAAQRNDLSSARREWTQARDGLEPALRAGDDPNFLAAYAEARLRLDDGDGAQASIGKLAAMGYRTPDFVALLESRQIAYPANAEFAQRIAAIMDEPPVARTDPSTPPR
ncbi:MAG: TIR domain-containing protein [Rhodanobacteraceae bacterium]|jgi:tetratricopeptide (TPR) repeat protein|nr:TIR domain-containing protein [Rhodanobacteraceae bacterium]